MNKFFLLFIGTFAYTLTAFAQQQNYKEHRVKEGESIETIATYYRITKDELLQLNPEARNGLTPNAVLLIPSKNSDPVTQLSQQVEIKFKKHKVRRKETLFSISQRYNITIEEIKRYNEELYTRDLRKGEKIRIPKYKVKPVKREDTHVVQGTIIHVVKPKETRWGIANSYGITIKELQRLNPEMGEIIAIGDTLHLPKKENILETPTSDAYIFYEVKPKETLYSLTRFLNITTEELEDLNPALKAGLKAGMILKLPKEKGAELDVEDAVIVKKINLIDSINRSHVSNIVFMLPFKLNSVQMDSIDLVRKKMESDRVFNYAIDFYSGALMAIDSLKTLGVSVHVKAFDTERSRSKIDQILVFNDFENTHAIIGPFHAEALNTISEALKRDDIPVISPLTSKNITLYDNVFQTVPSEEYLREKMIDFMTDNAEDKHIVIVTDDKSIEIKERLLSKFPDAQLLMPEKDKTITLYQISRMLSKEKENWFILETSNESLVANITSVLNSINREKYQITLLTTCKTDVYDSNNISNVHLSNLSFHYPTIDKLSTLDNSFSKRYESQYYTTPSRYAIRGFDITFDTVLRIVYGENLYRAARLVGETEYVENKFEYDKKFFGGYYNKAYYIVKYDNLEIKEVKQ